MALECGGVADLRTYLVEVAFAFFFLAKHMSLPLFQEFIHSELKKSYRESSGNKSTLSPSRSLELRHESAITILSLQVAESLPAIVVVVVLGAVSDRMARRKILLWLPSLGLSSYAFVYIMSAYTGWKLDELFFAAALRGLSGSAPSFHAGASFFAVNGVRSEDRLFRLACQEFINSITFALGNLIVGYWVESAGFIPVFWFVFGCSMTSLIISVFGIQEVNAEPTPLDNNQCCRNIFGPLAKYLNCRDKTCLKIWLIIVSFQLITFIHVGQENTYVLYLMQAPHHWQKSNIGVYLCLMMGLAAAGTLFGIHIMQNFFQDSTIVLVGYLSRAIGTVWFGVVRKDYLIYCAPILLVFQLLPMPILRSMIAKLVQASDHASVFALMHSGQSVTLFLAPLVFTSIYNASIDVYIGLVFIASGIMIAAPAIPTMLLRFVKPDTEVRYNCITDSTALTASTEGLVASTSRPTPI